jgi:hypothetical protein
VAPDGTATESAAPIAAMRPPLISTVWFDTVLPLATSITYAGYGSTRIGGLGMQNRGNREDHAKGAHS